MLTHTINIFSLMRKKYLMQLTQGPELATTAVSVIISLDKKCIYSFAECLYDHIKRETFQMRTPASLQRQARVK